MSQMALPLLEPLKPPDAKRLAREIVENGEVIFSGHAQEEMSDDGLETTDCLNLIRGGVYEPAELIKGEWRYRITTQRICVVVAFASMTRLRVVTAWRIQQ